MASQAVLRIGVTVDTSILHELERAELTARERRLAAEAEAEQLLAEAEAEAQALEAGVERRISRAIGRRRRQQQAAAKRETEAIRAEIAELELAGRGAEARSAEDAVLERATGFVVAAVLGEDVGEGPQSAGVLEG